LASGGTIDFGTTQTGSPVTRTITVTNVGTANLVVSPIDPSTLPAGFSLESNVSTTTLAPGGSTTFTVQLNATAAGTLAGVIHVVSNDADEGSFDIVLAGVVSDPPPPAKYVRTIDNGAAGFSATGTWHAQTKNGFDQDIQFANKAEKNDKTAATATWTFTGLAAGQYRVTVTMPASPSYASDAPFSVFDGTSLLRTVAVNEKQVAGELAADGFRWQCLGTFAIRSGTLVVQLTNHANGQVVADAVKIEQVDASVDPGAGSTTTRPPNSKTPDHKGATPTHTHSASNKPVRQPKPAPHAALRPQSKGNVGSSPTAADPPWLDGLAHDVSLQHLKPAK
jgi:hypothetical protein